MRCVLMPMREQSLIISIITPRLSRAAAIFLDEDSVDDRLYTQTETVNLTTSNGAAAQFI